MSKEKQLLKAIFEVEKENWGEATEVPEMPEVPENYPETFLEKADYAEYVLQKSLEKISRTLIRIKRLCVLLRIGDLPDVTLYHESKIVAERLALVKGNIDDAYSEIQEYLRKYKEGGK